MSVVARMALGIVCVGASACLLPAPPPAPRYFAPSLAEPAPVVVAVAVRMAPVKSPVHLREQIVWRRSDVEIGFYDQRRWSELPAAYVERAIERELDAGAASAGDGGDVAVVAAELLAFEEVLAPRHEASVALAVEVRQGACPSLRREIATRRPIDGDDPAAMARAVGEALSVVARSVAEHVRDVTQRRRRCGVS